MNDLEYGKIKVNSAVKEANHLTASRLPADPVSRVAGPPCWQTGSARVPEPHPAGVLQDRAVDGPVGCEPALHAVKVSVGDGGRRGAHHVLKRV